MDPQRGVAYRFTLTLLATTTGAMLANPPLAAGDVQVSKDGGAFVALATLPSIQPSGSVCVQVALSAAEMTAEQVIIQALDPDGIWEPVLVELHPTQMLGTDARVLLSADPQPMLSADLQEIAGNPNSPAILDQSVRTMGVGVVGAGATTTSIPTSVLLPAAVEADQWKGRVLIFGDTTLTPALRGQTCDITASTATGILTVSAVTTAPVSGDGFVIL